LAVNLCLFPESLPRTVGSGYHREVRRGWLILTLLLLLPAVPGRAQWRVLKTAHFVLFYPEQRAEQAGAVMAELEQARIYVDRVLGLSGDRVSVVVMDLGITSNGLTDPLFRRILLYPYSPSTGELATVEDWWRLLGVHEYTHWAHLDAAAGFPRVLQALFGNLFAPNLLAPAWLLEGLCVYTESGLSPLEGRLNDGTFDAYVAALAQEDAIPSLAAATYQSTDFPGGTGPYLYGGVFVRYLVETCGEEAVREFIRLTSSSALSYVSPLLPAVGLDRSARKAFGRSLPALWKTWREAAAAGVDGRVSPHLLLPGEAGWLEEPVAAGGFLYYRRSRTLDRRPLETGRVYELLRLDLQTGRQTVLVRSSGPFTGPLVVRDGRLYYALLDLVPGFANTEAFSYGFTAQVWQLDLASGGRRRLLRVPLRTFTVLSDGDILFSQDRSDGFGSSLRLLRAADGRTRRLFDTEFLVAEIESGPEGLFVSARRDGESFAAYRVARPPELNGAAERGRRLSGTALSAAEMKAEDLRLERLFPQGASQRQLCLADGRLYFCANPGGLYRVYARDLGSGRTVQSDSLGYQSSPAFDAASGRLYGLTLVAGGYALCELPDPLAAGAGGVGAGGAGEVGARGPEVGGAGAPSLEAPLTERPEVAVDARRGGYPDNLATLLPRVLLPVLSFDSVSLGVRAGAALLGMSALGDLAYQLSVYYDSASGEAELEGALQYQPAFPLQAEVEFATVGGNLLGVSLGCPLFRSLTPGFWYLTMGASASLFGPGFSRLRLGPVAGFGLHGPFTELEVQLGLPFERVELGSDRNAVALTGGVTLGQVLGPLELHSEAVWVSAFDGSRWLLPAARGYPARLPASMGAAGGVELWVPLFRVRRGLWNPGLYLEDIYLAGFTDASLADSLALQLSFGGELHVELRAFAAATGVPVDLFARLSVTREGQPGVSVGLEAAGLEKFIRHVRREVTGP
jgi:hypothetical protein